MNVFEWVRLARDPNHGQRKFIFVKDKVAQACDRHRVHRASVELLDGVYDVDCVKVADQTHPDFNNVFFDLAEASGMAELNQCELRTTLLGDTQIPLYHYGTEFIVRPMYIEEAAQAENPTLWYFGEGARTKISGFSEFGDFVIAGVKS